MVFTEIRDINGKKYYYRAVSVRQGDKVSKKRKYLGSNLNSQILKSKEMDADKVLLSKNNERKISGLNKFIPKLRKLLKSNHVNRAGVFGSYARGEQRKNSDIDIVINLDDENASLLDYIELVNLIEKSLGKKVDLVEYSSIKPRLKDKILKEEIRII